MGNNFPYHAPEAVIKFKRGFRIAGVAAVTWCVLAGSLVCTIRATGVATTNAWSLSGNVAVRGMYEGNVYLQSRGPMRNRESFITSLLPQAGLRWMPSGTLDAMLGYNAGLHLFHQEPGQDQHGASGGGNRECEVW